MEHSVDIIRKRNSQVYYDYLLPDDIFEEKTETILKSKPKKKTKKSFGSIEIKLSDLSFAPENWELTFYSAYFALIPYLVGNLFLFIVITGGVFENYKLLDKSAFFIIWAIGYEIVATVALIWIFISYLKYNPTE